MCDNPVIRKISNRFRTVKVVTPCGGCLGCRLDNLMLWSARCNSEFIKYRSAFLTFTYDDFHLKYNDGAVKPSLCRDDLGKYIDNVRHQIKALPVLTAGCISDFKYFGCGEYGDSFQRPHYHVLCFGLDFKDYERFFKKTWKNGMIKSLPILSGGVRYVVDYMTKNLSGELAEKEYDLQGRERPFYSCSRGLGSDFFYAHSDEIAETGNVTIGSRVIPVPSYYQKLFLNLHGNDVPSRLKLHMDSYKKVLNKALSLGFRDYDSYVEYCRKSNESRYASYYRSHGVGVSPSFGNNYSSLRDIVETAFTA